MNHRPGDGSTGKRETTLSRASRAGPYRAGARPGPAVMRVQVGDTDSVEALIEFLRRRACHAERLGGDAVVVEFPDELDPERELLELDLYLAVFRSTHPGVEVQIAR